MSFDRSTARVVVEWWPVAFVEVKRAWFSVGLGKRVWPTVASFRYYADQNQDYHHLESHFPSPLRAYCFKSERKRKKKTTTRTKLVWNSRIKNPCSLLEREYDWIGFHEFTCHVFALSASNFGCMEEPLGVTDNSCSESSLFRWKKDFFPLSSAGSLSLLSPRLHSALVASICDASHAAFLLCLLRIVNMVSFVIISGPRIVLSRILVFYTLCHTSPFSLDHLEHARLFWQ